MKRVENRTTQTVEGRAFSVAEIRRGEHHGHVGPVSVISPRRIERDGVTVVMLGEVIDWATAVELGIVAP